MHAHCIRVFFMSETSISLLDRLRKQPDDAAWQRLVDLYTPLLRSWLKQQMTLEGEAEDLVQEVLIVLTRELPKFEHNGRPGAFRRWLKTVLVHRLQGYWRARQSRPIATGHSDFAQKLDQLEDPASGLSQLWDREHDRHVMARLMAQIEPQVAPATWHAFRLVVIEGKAEETVAKE